MTDGFTVPSTFEEATSLWDNLGCTMAHAHLRRAQLVFAILSEHSNKFGRMWSAEELGKEWRVTAERIRRYLRTVKVFGDELESLIDLPKISWTHLEEIARITDPHARQDVLAAIQAEGLSSNDTRHRVTALLGEGTAATDPGPLPKFPGGAKNVSTELGENEAFLATMYRLAEWASRSRDGLRALQTKIGPDGLYAADQADQGQATDARNRLDELTDAIAGIRPLLNNSLPLPEPKNPDPDSAGAIFENPGGRIIDP